MKRLVIQYGGLELFCGDVSEFQWQESGSAVAATGKLQSGGGNSKGKPGGGPAALIEALVSAKKSHTQDKVDSYRSGQEEAAVVVDVDGGGDG